MILRNCKIIDPFYVIEAGYIEIENSFIKDVGAGKKVEGEDLSGLIVLPGFVDSHIHGALGFDTMDADESGLKRMEQFLYSKGVTTFLPTTMSCPFENLVRTLDFIKDYKAKYPSTSVEGVHVEGPYISQEKKGAQNPNFVRPPKIEEVKQLVENYKDIIKVITIAPEIENAIEAIKIFEQSGITTSLGHSAATYDEFFKGYMAGSRRMTHFFNGMSPFHHREVGLVGGGLIHEDMYIELICDKIHSTPEAIKLVFKNKDLDKVILITDSMRATGLKPGEYELGKQKVIVNETSARLTDGTLAGSILTLNEAVKNVISITGFPLKDVLKSAVTAPLNSIRLYDRGRIRKGFKADLVVIDEKLDILMTIKNGRVVYSV